MGSSFEWHRRLRASVFHLACCLVMAAIVAALVLLIWYPGPYREASGGIGLLLLLLSVDVALGPLLTFATFDSRKPTSELRRDLTVIIALQLGALFYGLHTVYLARPVVLALEVDRFRAVIAASVVERELPEAPATLRSLSLTGPIPVNTRAAAEGDEKFDAIVSAAAGADLGMRPRFWTEWDDSARAAAKRVGRPVSELYMRYASESDTLNAAVAKTGRPIEQLIYIPMLARRTDWSVLVDKSTGDPVGFAPVDGF